MQPVYSGNKVLQQTLIHYRLRLCFTRWIFMYSLSCIRIGTVISPNPEVGTAYLHTCSSLVSLTKTTRGLKRTNPGQGHCVWRWLCYGSCGDSVIIMALLIPIHLSCLITSSVFLSVLSQVNVLCFQINIKSAVGGSSLLAVLMSQKRGESFRKVHNKLSQV